MTKLSSLVIFLSLILITGCATKPRVSIDYDTDYNFSQLKTFSVKETTQDTKENLLVSPFTLKHIYSLLNSELSKHYQATSEAITPDFYVSYHVIMEEKLDPRNYDDLYGFGYLGRGYNHQSPLLFHSGFAGVEIFNQGSLIVDMVDAKTQKPIWRGVSEKRLNKNSSPQQQRQILTNAVVEVMAKYPPIK